MKTSYDLVIIGDGPAGMAAAITANRFGISTLVISEQNLPGGQIYNNVEKVNSDLKDILGPDYTAGEILVKKYREANVERLHGAVVWHVEIETDIIISLFLENDAWQISAKRIIIATGARERPIAFPGSTLPGIMAVTAAEVLLKKHNMVPGKDLVLGGSGPLLLLSASRLISAGVTVKAILDTTPSGNFLSALKYLPKALLTFGYLYKGIRMKRKIKEKHVLVYKNVKHLKAGGKESLDRVSFNSVGKTHEIETEMLLLHNGVVPDTQMSMLMNCDHEWYDVQKYWRPAVNRWGETSVRGVGIAGDATGISGAKAAEYSGHIAGLKVAFSLKLITESERNQKSHKFHKLLTKEALIRPFLDHLFKPSQDLLVPRDDQTIVCRCEEITAGQIRDALNQDMLTPNQLKGQTRCGMGPCQGRMCGLTVSEMIADYQKTDISDVGYFHIRPPLKPVTMAQLSKIKLLNPLEDFNEIR